jgi:hypothetical protein
LKGTSFLEIISDEKTIPIFFALEAFDEILFPDGFAKSTYQSRHVVGGKAQGEQPLALWVTHERVPTKTKQTSVRCAHVNFSKGTYDAPSRYAAVNPDTIAISCIST